MILIKILGIPNPENILAWSFQSYCNVWINFIEPNTDKQDKYNHKWQHKLLPQSLYTPIFSYFH